MPLTLSGSALGLGKVLQVVRATDTTDRSTTSTSMTDTGLSVTITPLSAANSIILIATGSYENSSTTNNTIVQYAITNSSNTIVPGAWTKVGTANFTISGTAYLTGYITLVGYSSPATTSAVTYKMRYLSEVSTTTNKLVNSSGTTGQMFAFEIGA